MGVVRVEDGWEVPVFYGDGDQDPHEWTSGIEAFGVEQEFSDFDHIWFAHGFIEGKAAAWYDEETTQSAMCTWSDFKTRLFRRFRRSEVQEDMGVIGRLLEKLERRCVEDDLGTAKEAPLQEEMASSVVMQWPEENPKELIPVMFTGMLPTDISTSYVLKEESFGVGDIELKETLFPKVEKQLDEEMEKKAGKVFDIMLLEEIMRKKKKKFTKKKGFKYKGEKHERKCSNGNVKQTKSAYKGNCFVQDDYGQRGDYATLQRVDKTATKLEKWKKRKQKHKKKSKQRLKTGTKLDREKLLQILKKNKFIEQKRCTWRGTQRLKCFCDMRNLNMDRKAAIIRLMRLLKKKKKKKPKVRRVIKIVRLLEQTAIIKVDRMFLGRKRRIKVRLLLENGNRVHHMINEKLITKFKVGRKEHKFRHKHKKKRFDNWERGKYRSNCAEKDTVELLCLWSKEINESMGIITGIECISPLVQNCGKISFDALPLQSGTGVLAGQVFNGGIFDTENMEVKPRYGNKDQIFAWLILLIKGNICSGFGMTKQQAASSDATNIEYSSGRQGDSYVINSTKWWTSRVMDLRCKVLILMGKSDFNTPNHKQQAMIAVYMGTPSTRVTRPLTVFGFDDGPHGHAEISFANVMVPATTSHLERRHRENRDILPNVERRNIDGAYGLSDQRLKSYATCGVLNTAWTNVHKKEDALGLLTSVFGNFSDFEKEDPKDIDVIISEKGKHETSSWDISGQERATYSDEGSKVFVLSLLQKEKKRTSSKTWMFKYREIRRTTSHRGLISNNMAKQRATSEALTLFKLEDKLV